MLLNANFCVKVFVSKYSNVLSKCLTRNKFLPKSVCCKLFALYTCGCAKRALKPRLRRCLHFGLPFRTINFQTGTTENNDSKCPSSAATGKN